MSWFIDYKIAKADAEDMAQLEEKIQRYKKLLSSQPWPQDTEREMKSIISKLETQLALYQEAA